MIIVGGSHVAAVRNALHHFEPGDGTLTFEAYTSQRPQVKAGATPLEGALDRRAMEKMVAGSNEQAHFVSMMRGNFHHTVAMGEHPVPFDFMLPGYDDQMDPGRHLIPFHVMAGFFEDQLRTSYAVLWHLRELKRGPVHYVMAPPPKEHADHYVEQSGRPDKWQAVLERGLAPASLRLKCWLLQQRVMRSLCGEKGINFIPVPAGSQCPKGFLKPGYCLDDATHANSAYGALVLRQLEALIGTPQDEAIGDRREA